MIRKGESVKVALSPFLILLHRYKTKIINPYTNQTISEIFPVAEDSLNHQAKRRYYL